MSFRNQPMMDLNRRRSHNKIIRADGTIEEAEETEDDISARDIATARYKRNHDYLSEIFNPAHTKNTAITNTPIEQTKEELNQLDEQNNQQFKQQQQKHADKMKQIEQENKEFWELMNQLNDANTLENIHHASNDLAASMGLKMQFKPAQVNQISIPESMEL